MRFAAIHDTLWHFASGVLSKLVLFVWRIRPSSFLGSRSRSQSSAGWYINILPDLRSFFLPVRAS
jgi:hypothetical protein